MVVSLVLLVGVIVFAVSVLGVAVVVVIVVVVVVVGGNGLWLLQRSSVQQDVSRSALSQTLPGAHPSLYTS